MHGGVVESVQVRGNLHLHGGVVERLTVQGDCQQFGGIVEQRIIMAGAQATCQQQEPKVVYRDRVVYKRDRPADPKISSLQAYNAQLSAKLRRANDQIAALNEELLKLRTIKQVTQEDSDDNVLISRINHLKGELDKEREAHRKEVDELNWRLKAVTDIANGRNAVNYDRGEVEQQTEAQRIKVSDDTLDVLFTLINEYPICTDSDKCEELGISPGTLKYIVKALRLAKSPEQRREARERLQRHGIDLIERRGGDQTKNKKKSKTTKTKRQ